MNGRKADSTFTKEIDNAIKLEKNIEAERMSYMTYEMKIREFNQADSMQVASDDDVLTASKELMQRNKHVYEELAK